MIHGISPNTINRIIELMEWARALTNFEDWSYVFLPLRKFRPHFRSVI